MIALCQVKVKDMVGTNDLRRASLIFVAAIFSVASLFISQPVAAQMIEVATPFNTVTDSFNQRMGVDFGFQLQGGRGPGSRTTGFLPGGVVAPNIAFRQNGVSSAIPQFGDFDPNAQATFGFINASGGNQFGLGLSFGQGSTRTHTSTTPSVVMQNGTSGSIFSGTISPFVTGFIPVVGNEDPNVIGVYEERPNYLRELLNRSPLDSSGYSDLELNGPREAVMPFEPSSATVAARGVDAIKAERERALAFQSAEANAKIQELIARAEKAEADSKVSLARSYYRSALKEIGDADGFSDLRSDLAERFNKLAPPKKK